MHKKFVQIRFITAVVTAKSSISSYGWELGYFAAVDYTEATVECEQWPVEDSNSDTWEDSEAVGRQRSCRPFVNLFSNRTLNCWRVNESWIVDITEFLTQRLSAAFATKSLLEIGGDDCDSLDFTNFRKRIFRNFKIRKIRILNLCLYVMLLCTWPCFSV